MKTKRLQIVILLGSVLWLAGCANENTSKEESRQDASSEELMEFAEENNAPLSRTLGEYDGTGINFFWTENDRLWIYNPAAQQKLKQDAKNTINSQLTWTIRKAATAKFYFEGNYTANSYNVRYTGNGSNAGDKVIIKSVQTQKAPNDASHFGESGDCGVAFAQKSGGRYNFTLEHKSAYLTFLPYSSMGGIRGAKIMKIKIKANKAISGTYTLNDNGITSANPQNGADSVALTLKDGFPIPASPTIQDNAAFMVVAPGTYSKLSVEYTLNDPVTQAKGTITKDYTNVTLHPGANKRIVYDFQVPVYNPTFYMWDAQKHFWEGHEGEQVKIPYKIPPTTVGYPKNAADPRWYNTMSSLGVATHTAKDCIDVNEAMWYVLRGDVHFDNSMFVIWDHLYAGGVWIKRKAHISGFTSNISPNGLDYRMLDYGDIPMNKRPADISIINYTKRGKPATPSQYFYVPAVGYYWNTGLYVGNVGLFWTKTPVSYAKYGASHLNTSAYQVLFTKDFICVRGDNGVVRYLGCTLSTLQ